MLEYRSKWIEKSTRIWGKKTMEVAENWLQRFRMEGGARKRLADEK